MKEHAIFDGGAAIADVVTSAQMKDIEKSADDAGLTYYQMMENAGTGAAEYIASREQVAGKTVVVICGKGNNGGDGFVAARKLTEKGAIVSLILAEGEPKTEDALKNKQLCEILAIPMHELKEENEICLLADAELIVDAVYGTGFRGVLRDPVRKVTRGINRSGAVVYALDIPSGLSGDTGESDEDTVRACSTIAFHRFKPAHMNEKCNIYCGQTICIPIGIEAVLE